MMFYLQNSFTLNHLIFTLFYELMRIFQLFGKEQEGPVVLGSVPKVIQLTKAYSVLECRSSDQIKFTENL